MNALTKILIILLTLSSIFLCGIVVTYVANAGNYRDLYEQERKAKQLALTRKNNADEQLRQSKEKFQQQEDKLNRNIASLNTQLSKIKSELTTVKREKAELVQKVADMASVVETSSQTARQQTQLFRNTQDELKQLRANHIRQGKDLDETTAELIARIAVLETLQADKKRLEEEKYALQRQLDGFLHPRGKEAAAIPTITPAPPPSPRIPAVAEDIGLKAVITAVDLKNAVAEISIGAAHGVREGMKFYVIRGAEFICEVWIFDVDTERAVGKLERVGPRRPNVGDDVATNL